jgi:ankyrin repeat protein
LEWRHVGNASLLIEKGAHVNTRDKDERTLLHWVLQMENLDVARLLIKYGADVNAMEKGRRTPLFLALKGDILTVHAYFSRMGPT